MSTLETDKTTTIVMIMMIAIQVPNVGQLQETFSRNSQLMPEANMLAVLGGALSRSNLYF